MFAIKKRNINPAIIYFVSNLWRSYNIMYIWFSDFPLCFSLPAFAGKEIRMSDSARKIKTEIVDLEKQSIEIEKKNFD